MDCNKENLKKNNYWLVFIMLYLLVDLGRIQDVVPIGSLRPGMIFNLILILFIISSRGFKQIFNRQVKLIFLFILLLAIHIPFSSNNYYAFKAFSGMALYFPVIISIVIVINSIEKLEMFIKFNIVLMIYICLYGIFHDGIGSGGYFNDENDLCLYVVTMISFSYYLFFHKNGYINKIIYGSCTIISLMTIVVTFSRGGLIGLLAVASVVFYLSKNKIQMSIVCTVLGVIIFSFFADDSYRMEMGTIADTNESTAMGRLMSWKAGWLMFLDNPLGVGGNNFMIRFPEYQPSWFSRSMWGRAAHSLWFTLLPELGIVGVYLYFKLVIYNINDLLFIRKCSLASGLNRNTKYLHLIGLSLLASFGGFFGAASFLSVLYYPYFWYMTALVVAITNIYRTELVSTAAFPSR